MESFKFVPESKPYALLTLFARECALFYVPFFVLWHNRYHLGHNMAKRKYKRETELFNTRHHRQMQRNIEKMFSSSPKNNDENSNENQNNSSWFILIWIIILLLVFAKKCSHWYNLQVLSKEMTSFFPANHYVTNNVPRWLSIRIISIAYKI